MTAETVKHTEASMLKLLRERHAKDAGNGPAWAYMEHVRDNSGFSAKRTCDALALHLWQSRGHELHGFEVKVSRSDWRRELADPDKADGWCKVVDRWWIVAPRGVVPAGEVPATWGLMETRGQGLTATVQAPLLRPKGDRPLIDRPLMSCMLRAAGAGLQTTPDDAALAVARAEGEERGRQNALRSGKDWQQLYEKARERQDADRATVREIEQVLGVPIASWMGQQGTERAKSVAAALQAVLASDDAAKRAKQQLAMYADRLDDVARSIRQAAG